MYYVYYVYVYRYPTDTGMEYSGYDPEEKAYLSLSLLPSFLPSLLPAMQTQFLC